MQIVSYLHANWVLEQHQHISQCTSHTRLMPTVKSSCNNYPALEYYYDIFTIHYQFAAFLLINTKSFCFNSSGAVLYSVYTVVLTSCSLSVGLIEL